MLGRMQAARWHGRGDVRVEEVAQPQPGPGELLLRVAWCGICGTDVEEYLTGPAIIPTDVPNPLTGRAALQWDMQTPAEEQTLVQPM